MRKPHPRVILNKRRVGQKTCDSHGNQIYLRREKKQTKKSQLSHKKKRKERNGVRNTQWFAGERIRVLPVSLARMLGIQEKGGKKDKSCISLLQGTFNGRTRVGITVFQQKGRGVHQKGSFPFKKKSGRIGAGRGQSGSMRIGKGGTEEKSCEGEK